MPELTPLQAAVFTAIIKYSSVEKKIHKEELARICCCTTRDIRRAVSQLVQAGHPVGRIGGFYPLRTPEQARREYDHAAKKGRALMRTLRGFRAIEQRLAKPQLGV